MTTLSAKRAFSVLLFSAALCASATAAFSGPPSVPALRETAVNGTANESVFGVAIWTAQNPAQSRIIAAQPQGEIDFYDLNGVIVQRIAAKGPRSIDVRDTFFWTGGDGGILAASDTSDASISLFKIDPKTGNASAKPRGKIRTSLRQISGVCLGQSGADGMLIAVGMNAKGEGEVHSWTLAIDPWGDATGIKLGAYKLGAALSACTIDDKTGALYVAEGARGIWRLDIADAKGIDRKLIDTIKPEGRLSAPINALAMQRSANTVGGQSYLLASAGPTASLLVYNAQSNALLGEIAIGKAKKAKADAVTGGWGLGASGANFGADAPMGVVAIQDVQNTSPKAAPNIKIVSFADIKVRMPAQ